MLRASSLTTVVTFWITKPTAPACSHLLPRARLLAHLARRAARAADVELGHDLDITRLDLDLAAGAQRVDVLQRAIARELRGKKPQPARERAVDLGQISEGERVRTHVVLA